REAPPPRGGGAPHAGQRRGGGAAQGGPSEDIQEKLNRLKSMVAQKTSSGDSWKEAGGSSYGYYGGASGASQDAQVAPAPKRRPWTSTGHGGDQASSWRR
ncbi:unnamed protein product, partial [Prorocentrum cordatum]